MLIVVGKLLSAHGTDDVTGTRFRLLNILRSLFCWCQFLGLLGQVLQILLVKEALVLLSKLALFL